MEARIENPHPTYDFFLAIGGQGTEIDGESASRSYFGSELELYANGGEGGKTSQIIFNINFVAVGKGGQGGTAGGSLSTFICDGGAGDSAFASMDAGTELGFSMDGIGGSNHIGSIGEYSIIASTQQSFSIQIANGVPGLLYGAGGSGGKAISFPTDVNNNFVTGGDGASAYLIIHEFS